MADVMKAMGSGKRGAMAGLANMLGLRWRRHAVDRREMAKLAEKMPGGPPPGTPGSMPGLPGDTGAAAKFPGLAGLGGTEACRRFPGFRERRNNHRFNRYH